MKRFFDEQQAWFRSGATRETESRADSLRHLREAMLRHESELLRALHNDLGKTPEEGYLTELGPVYAEIGWMLRHLRRLSAARRILLPPLENLTRGVVFRDPYGVVLNLSGWTCPLRLSLLPLADALAAGNCVTVCPSARAPQTAQALRMVLEEALRADLARVTECGREAAAELLALPFDKIFFSGSPEDGHEVLRAAAETFAPVSMELGGKNPVVVTADADIRLAARRVVFGKTLGAGQTCAAPDYVLVARAVETDLLTALRAQIVEQFGRRPLESRDLPRIVSEEHFDRLTGLMRGQNVFCGGGWNRERLRIEPTVITRPEPHAPLMQEQIFGPILPVIPYGAMQEAVLYMRQFPTPQSLCCFTADQRAARRLMRDMAFGFGCVNDCLPQGAPAMPFGFAGGSGMGALRGRAGYECFSREKGVCFPPVYDSPLRYAPRKGTLTELHKKIR